MAAQPNKFVREKIGPPPILFQTPLQLREWRTVQGGDLISDHFIPLGKVAYIYMTDMGLGKEWKGDYRPLSSDLLDCLPRGNSVAAAASLFLSKPFEIHTDTHSLSFPTLNPNSPHCFASPCSCSLLERCKVLSHQPYSASSSDETSSPWTRF